MLNNIYYFEYSREHPEKMFDPYYAKNKIIIPTTADEKNILSVNNDRLIDLITAFDVAISMGKNDEDPDLNKIILEIKNILEKTKNINYSPFCQFFMVHNSSHASFMELDDEAKIAFLREILKDYCDERHGMYKSYGYSNMSLQVVCDNYSHKRNSKTSIIKFEDMISPYAVRNYIDANMISQNLLDDEDYYFLPDKTGKKCFIKLMQLLDIRMESRAIEQSKMPDVVFKHDGQYYIFELKMMKGGGGGQNKQAVEFAYFIKFSEKNRTIHYGVLLDSLYANDLFGNNQPKIAEQRQDVVNALKNNGGNYFVNTAGAERLLSDIFADNENRAIL